MEKKKRIYKRWWFWLIIVIILIAFIVPTSEEESTNEPKEVSQDKNEPENETVKEVEQEGKKTIEVNKEIEFDNLTISLENVYVEDGTMSFGFWWSHWKSNDKAHFTAFAYPVVKQNDKELEQIDKKDTLLKQTKKGVDSRVDLEYDLIDDSPVTIIFKTTTDEPEEESITIKLQ